MTLHPNSRAATAANSWWLPYSTALLLVHAFLLLVWQVSQVAAGSWHFPLDDAYIHLAYARTLALTGVWGFNPGIPGTGATSLLWPLLELPGWWLGRPEAWGWIVGALWLLFLGHVIWRLVRKILPERHPAIQILAWAVIALQGHLFLLGLSGMESIALVACGLGVFVFLEEGRWKTAGLLAGLAAVLRPEGLLVGATATAWIAWNGIRSGTHEPRTEPKRWAGGLGWVALPAAVGFVAYALVNLAVGGGILPTTYGGRSHLVFSGHPGLGGRLYLMAKYPLSWVHHVLFYEFAGRALNVAGVPEILVLMWVLVVGAVLLGGAGLLSLDLRRSTETPRGRVLIPFLGWTLLHNGAYLFLLPQRGNAGRYQAMNFIWVGLFLIWILLLFFKERPFPAIRRPALGLPACFAGLAIALGVVPSWAVQHYCAQRMTQVYESTVRFLKRPDSPRGKVAVFDIGYLGCFSGRRLVDLGGLLHNDPEIWSNPRGYAIRKGATMRIYQGNDFDASRASADRHGDRVVHQAVYSGPYGEVLQQAMAGATNGMVVLEIVREDHGNPW